MGLEAEQEWSLRIYGFCRLRRLEAAYGIPRYHLNPSSILQCHVLSRLLEFHNKNTTFLVNIHSSVNKKNVLGGAMDLLVTPNSYLVGASGGVYTILAAFLANLVLNWDKMSTFGKIVRLSPIGGYLAMDLTTTIIRFMQEGTNGVSWSAHLGGTNTNFIQIIGVFFLDEI